MNQNHVRSGAPIFLLAENAMPPAKKYWKVAKNIVRLPPRHELTPATHVKVLINTACHHT